jgi:hypothetical protein
MNDEKNELPVAINRPTSITIICGFGFIGSLCAVAIFFLGSVSSMGAWYPPFLATSIVVGLVSFVGLWKMKRWGAFWYLALSLINQVVLLAMGKWSIIALILPAIVLAVVLPQFKKLR